MSSSAPSLGSVCSPSMNQPDHEMWLCQGSARSDRPDAAATSARAAQAGQGAIVNYSSVSGKALSSYDDSKHGVIGLTKTAAMNNDDQGIRINAVCPAAISTLMVAKIPAEQTEAMDEFLKLQAIGRLGTTDEVAQTLLWLYGDGASFVAGTTLVVDGCFTANGSRLRHVTGRWHCQHEVAIIGMTGPRRERLPARLFCDVPQYHEVTRASVRPHMASDA